MLTMFRFRRRYEGLLSGMDDSTPPIAARVLHTSQRFEISPSFSPDGQSLAYCADVGGTLHVFVSTIDGASERQLTNGEEGEAQPSWSPDGRWIAYTSMRSGG